MLSSNTSAVSGDANYIEDVFSTWLYTGTGVSNNIVNGIDLSTKGGLVWLKNRGDTNDHFLFDTVRGGSSDLSSNTTAGVSGAAAISFLSNGFNCSQSGSNTNASGANYASWTFREQPKFFDVVTYTGDGNTTQAINHNLGSVPGCIIVKRTDSGTNWFVYHKNLTSYQYSLYLNDTTGQINAGGSQFGANPTSTQFTVGSGYPNTSGGQYVAYIFAHDAGGFGLTGTDNVISCGSYTGTGSAVPVSLGYEPQWLLVKKADGYAADWVLLDTMRGMPTGGISAFLAPNLSSAENASVNTSLIDVSSTGFNVVGVNGRVNESGATYIYIAIRRGPMKVPTDATKVFAPVVVSAPTTNQVVTTNFPVDLSLSNAKQSTSYGTIDLDRLRGSSTSSNQLLQTQSTAAEGSNSGWGIGLQSNTSIVDNMWNSTLGYDTGGVVYWNFRRAPSFFDEVCYTGDGGNQNVTHNLNATPELIIVKGRSIGQAWCVYNATSGNTKRLFLNNTDPEAVSTSTWNSTSPTSTVFTVGGTSVVNGAGSTYVAYLFATCAGVSKVGSYTGNGSTQAIACGFTGGARFVLIKRTDSTGDWYMYDTARGMTTLTDPYLRLNSTAAESATLGSVTTTTGGFTVNASILAAINTNAASYIFLAVA